MDDKYDSEITKTANEISLKSATTSLRTGKGKARDTIVFGKMVWGEAFSYISPVQTMIIFTALITPSIITINKGLYEFGSYLGMAEPFQFPIEAISILAVVSLVIVLIFGFISVRVAGTYRTTNEWAAKMNPGMRLVWNKTEAIRKQNEEILKRLKTLEEK